MALLSPVAEADQRLDAALLFEGTSGINPEKCLSLLRQFFLAADIDGEYKPLHLFYEIVHITSN